MSIDDDVGHLKQKKSLVEYIIILCSFKIDNTSERLIERKIHKL